jgi:hypothetical protein
MIQAETPPPREQAFVESHNGGEIHYFLDGFPDPLGSALPRTGSPICAKGARAPSAFTHFGQTFEVSSLKSSSIA